MDIQQLRYYVEIIKNKSYTKSAKKLAVTQPMLTRVVKQLEEELNTPLIERTSKSFEITESGLLLYEQALDLLLAHEDIYRNLNDVKGLKTGEVRLSIPGVILDIYFPELLRNFHACYPGIKISIVEEGSKLTIGSVMEGKADLGMVMLPIRRPENLEVKSVWQSSCRWVAQKDHPLADKEKVYLRELKREKFSTFSDTATLHDFFISNCIKEGFTPDIIYKSLTPNFLFDMVSYGLCSTIMPDPVINRYRRPDVAIISLHDAIPWELAIIVNQERYQSHAARRLKSYIVDHFKMMNQH